MAELMNMPQLDVNKNADSSFNETAGTHESANKDLNRNVSFKSLNGGHSEEEVKLTTCSIPNILDKTNTLLESPLHCTNAITSRLQTAAEGSFSEACHESPILKFDVKPLSPATDLLDTSNVLQRSPLKSTFPELLSDIPNSLSTVELNTNDDASLEEIVVAHKSANEMSAGEMSFSNTNNISVVDSPLDKVDILFDSPLNTSLPLEPPLDNIASLLQKKSKGSVASLLDTTSVESPSIPLKENLSFQGAKEEAEIGISFTSTGSHPNLDSSVFSENVASNVQNESLPHQDTEIPFSEDLNKNALHQTSTEFSSPMLMANDPIPTDISGDQCITDEDPFKVPGIVISSNSSAHNEMSPGFGNEFSQLPNEPSNNDQHDSPDVALNQCITDEDPFKVPGVVNSSNSSTHNEMSPGFGNEFSQLPNEPSNIDQHDFPGVALRRDAVMQKPDPFDLMGIDAKPADDFIFKVPENPVETEGEEFMDAVQFFKDPSSFQFLENIQTAQSATNVPRSSLYIKFDPLHSTISAQKNPDEVLQALKSETNIDPNKRLNLSARESLGNILISFDSPRSADTKTPVLSAPVKVYTEEELQQHLKVNELTNQEVLLKKQRDMEEEMVKKEKEMMASAEEKDAKISALEKICRMQEGILAEFALVASTVSENKKEMLRNLEESREECTKLKEDVKTLTDDLQSVETTFADFHKRYEQCKTMLKTYKDNEEILRNKLKEQEQAYQDLQDQAREASEKASSELCSIKKTSEGQNAVLKAQLKKAELKISSLESDIKQIKIENSQLGGICDDLMEKVGHS